MTDSQRQELFQAMMGSIRKTGDKVLDRIFTEFEAFTVAEINKLEPIIDRMIQDERAERFRMLLEICEARCSRAAR